MSKLDDVLSRHYASNVRAEAEGKGHARIDWKSAKGRKAPVRMADDAKRFEPRTQVAESNFKVPSPDKVQAHGRAAFNQVKALKANVEHLQRQKARCTDAAKRAIFDAKIERQCVLINALATPFYSSK
jgi:hypothetical protein